jgi:hypothetical protein
MKLTKEENQKKNSGGIFCSVLKHEIIVLNYIASSFFLFLSFTNKKMKKEIVTSSQNSKKQL